MKRDIVVVTGGSAGIGLATAERLVQDGRDVVILARGQPRLDEAASMLKNYGNRVLALSVDMADAAAVDAAAQHIEKDFGPIGAWVNNAMSTVVAPADRISAADYARVTATTYLSQVHGTLAALRYMKPRGRGSIVQVSSVLGYRAIPLQAPYCAAKFAVSGFTDSLRAELIADAIDIALSVVYLPAVNTPQFNWSRNLSGRRHLAPEPLYDPRVCAEAIAFAVDRPRREIWVGGRTLATAAAQAVAPGLADRAASGVVDDQLGEPVADRAGNLYAPVSGPAAIDGPGQASVTSSVGEILTSRDYAAAKLGLGAAFAMLVMLGLSALPKMRKGG